MEIVDRRKLGKEAEAVEAPEVKPVLQMKARSLGITTKVEQPREQSTWMDVAYMIAFMTLNGAQVISGRTLGLRSDGRSFVADYIFSPIWEEGFDWTEVGRERIDTFLNCDCRDGVRCEMHIATCQRWLEEGAMRIQSIANQGVPAAVEAFVREQQKQPLIHTAGR